MEKNGKKRNSNSFSSQKQPPSENKRVKKKKTILKEAIGLDSWESLQKYLSLKGAEKFIREMGKLKGKSFCDVYLSSTEYFKPKLARTELEHIQKKVFKITITKKS